MSRADNFGQQNIELMMELNRQFVESDEETDVPSDSVVVFVPDDIELREYNIALGLDLIEQGYDVFFKRVSSATASTSISR